MTRPRVSDVVSAGIKVSYVLYDNEDVPHVVEKARLFFPFDLAPHWSAAGFWEGCVPEEADVVLGFGASVLGFGTGVLGLGAVVLGLGVGVLGLGAGVFGF